MTTRNREMSARDQRLLELLSQGLANKVIAKRMGYKHGTTRVYLHQLYRKLGVAGKTAAVVWYVDQREAAPARTSRARPAEPKRRAGAREESVGDFALRTDLFTALGAMSLLVGPYGRLWEVAVRLKGEVPDAAVEARRVRARGLWEALLRADFAHAKRLYDDADELRDALQAPSEAVLLALLLSLGGYANASARVCLQLSRARRGTHRASAREMHLLEVVRAAFEIRKADAIERIHRAAMDAPAHTPMRHMAMAALFHAHMAHGDAERARHAAQALCAEAESSRQHLQSMGERIFAEDAAPVAAAIAAASATRHKEVAGR